MSGYNLDRMRSNKKVKKEKVKVKAAKASLVKVKAVKAEVNQVSLQ